MSGPINRQIINLQNFGHLLYRTIYRRGVKPNDLISMSKLFGLQLSPGELTHIFKHKRRSDEKVDFIIHCLQKGNVEDPLDERQARSIRTLYRNSEPSILEQNEYCLDYIGLRFANLRRNSVKLQKLVQTLRELNVPAYIEGPLQYMYAMNRMSVLFFQVQDRLNDWVSWHAVADKLVKDSPVCIAYTNSEMLLPGRTARFMESDLVHPYFFTKQMRKLSIRLQKLALKNEHAFNHWWHHATSFHIPLAMIGKERFISYINYGVWYNLQVEVQEVIKEYIEVEKGVFVPFSVVAYFPSKDNNQATNIFNILRKEQHGPIIYFASEFDDGTFHVSDWEDVDNADDSLTA